MLPFLTADGSLADGRGRHATGDPLRPADQRTPALAFGSPPVGPCLARGGLLLGQLHVVGSLGLEADPVIFANKLPNL